MLGASLYWPWSDSVFLSIAAPASHGRDSYRGSCDAQLISPTVHIRSGRTSRNIGSNRYVNGDQQGYWRAGALTIQPLTTYGIVFGLRAYHTAVLFPSRPCVTWCHIFFYDIVHESQKDRAEAKSSRSFDALPSENDCHKSRDTVS